MYRKYWRMLPKIRRIPQNLKICEQQVNCSSLVFYKPTKSFFLRKISSTKQHVCIKNEKLFPMKWYETGLCNMQHLEAIAIFLDVGKKVVEVIFHCGNFILHPAPFRHSSLFFNRKKILFVLCSLQHCVCGNDSFSRASCNTDRGA